MIPEESRFETDPGALLDDAPSLPAGWVRAVPDPDEAGADVARLTALLQAHEEAGRGWATAGPDDVLVEVAEPGLRTRENLVLRDEGGTIRAWAGVHDRSVGRMLLVLVLDRDLPADVARSCTEALLHWAEVQARAVARARRLTSQTIDTGTFAGDEQHAAVLRTGGFDRVRTWWQMSRPVTPDEAALVPDTERWEDRGVVYRLVSRDGGGAPADLPEAGDLRAVHDVLEESFTDHFGSSAETFDEWLFRQRETPGHRWDQWWLAELVEGQDDPLPAGALIGTVSEGDDGPGSAYVSYVGVVAAARGRGVAKGLLRTIIADAAGRGRESVGLEVDAESSTGADHLYRSLGWETRYTTESWHRVVALSED